VEVEKDKISSCEFGKELHQGQNENHWSQEIIDHRNLGGSRLVLL